MLNVFGSSNYTIFSDFLNCRSGDWYAHADTYSYIEVQDRDFSCGNHYDTSFSCDTIESGD